jgi:hypothetical protein
MAVERHPEWRILEDTMRWAPGSTRAASPRQLPTDHDYAVATREYQSDQPSHLPLDCHRGDFLNTERRNTAPS